MGGLSINLQVKLLLIYESALLILIGYFFWFASAFPADYAATGVEIAEWLWLVGLLVPLIVIYLVSHQKPQVVVVVLLALVVYLVVYRLILDRVGTSTAIDRADYIWLLVLLLPVVRLRFALHGRLWTHTPLDDWMVLILVLMVLSVDYAPYASRGYRMLARPLFGVALVLYLTELARITRSMAAPLLIMVALAFGVGILALFATQWTSKSDDFSFIIERLPRLSPFFAPNGFNPNEIAGALAWLTPFMAGLTFYPARWRWLAFAVSALLLAAVILGQSRSAVFGVVAAMIALSFLLVQSTRWRMLLLGGVAVIVLVQVAALVDLLPTSGGDGGGSAAQLSIRDERTSQQRLYIWQSAVEIVRDYPLTGVGMDRFRYPPVRDDYPVDRFDLSPPHAHNEVIQIATDLGLPGLVGFLGLNLTAVYLLWVCWRSGDDAARVVAAAAASGLLAHAVYGISDAIPLWDRFSFVYWMMLGITAAQYVRVRH
jgi:hypothetical protein